MLERSLQILKITQIVTIFYAKTFRWQPWTKNDDDDDDHHHQVDVNDDDDDDVDIDDADDDDDDDDEISWQVGLSTGVIRRPIMVAPEHSKYITW